MGKTSPFVALQEVEKDLCCVLSGISKYCRRLMSMAVEISGKIFYRTAEVCREVRISRTTLFRWLREGVINEPEHRDRRGWRLFTQDEVDRLMAEAHKISGSRGSRGNK